MISRFSMPMVWVVTEVMQRSMKRAVLWQGMMTVILFMDKDLVNVFFKIAIN